MDTDGLAPSHENGHRKGPIVHLLAPAQVGGLETVVRTLARAQLERGQPVIVAATGAEPSETAPFLESLDDSVPSRHLNVPHRAYHRERKAVSALLEESDARLLHTHGQRVDVVNGGIARRQDIPAVSTAHGFIGGGGLKSRFFRYLQMRSWRRFDAVVAVSHPLAEELRSSGVPKSRVHVVPNAWEPDVPPCSGEEARAVLGVEPSEFHLGWVGRLGREKGPDLFLDALKIVANEGRSFVASIVGEGPLEGELKERSASLQLDDRVRWHGSIPEASRLLKAFDAVVISSRTEGTPMVLLEAMAQGVPVVASAVGGIPHTLESREGYLVPPEDPRALARALLEVAVDPDEADARAARARRRILEERSLARWTARYEKIYRTAERSRASAI